MSSPEASCYTVVTEDNTETPSTQDLRTALQKGSDEVKLDTLRKIIVSTVNGNPQVCSRPSYTERKMNLVYVIARTFDADYPICHAIEEQNAQEDAALLLGGLPEVR